MKSSIWKWLSIGIVITLLSACTGDKPILEELSKDGSGNVKVMYYSEEAFYRQYGNLFAAKFPNINVEVVSTQFLYMQDPNEEEPVDPLKKLTDLIDKEQPDVIMADLEQMKQLIDKGKLYDLDPLVKQEQYGLDDMLPGLIDLLREQGNGGLYGLAPTYYTQVMMYNADLFKQYNIELPTNQMTWNQMLDLAARFGVASQGDDLVYGISNNYRDASDILLEIANSSNLQILDPNGEHVLLNSDGWKELFSFVAKSLNNNAFQPVDKNRGVAMNMVSTSIAGGGSVFIGNESAFTKGKAAMSIESPYMINQMDHTLNKRKDAKPFEWGMVSMPVDSNSPDQSSYVSVDEIYGINQNAANMREAWEMVKFINGPEMAKSLAKMSSSILPSRASYIGDKTGKGTEALTSLKPSSRKKSLNDIMEAEHIAYDFRSDLSKGINTAIEDMNAGKTADEVLSKLAYELQLKLVEARKKGSQGSIGGAGNIIVTP